MKRVVILGASGHAHVIEDIIKASGDRVAAFLDNDISIGDCAGSIDNYNKYLDCEFIIGIGNGKVRERLSELPVKWYTAIHPSAIISPSAKIGEGSAIMANAVLNARAQVGRHCIINTSAVIEHDDIIDDYAHISVGAKVGGTVTIGKSVWVGIGAAIVNNVQIHKNCIIGAGGVVVKDIDEPGTYVGVPVRRVK